MARFVTKIEDNKLYFDKERIVSEHRYKKITGTNISKLAGYSSFDTPDSVMLSRLGIFQPSFPEFYSIRGVMLEPVVIAHFEKLLGHKILRWEPKDVKWDNFQDDKLFGGLKDGQIIYQDEYGNERNVILEVKTTDTKKKASWHTEIPKDYYYQAGLYALLDDATDVFFLVCYCNEEVNNQIKNNEEVDYNSLEYDIFKLPFDNVYKKDVLEAKIKAASVASEIFDRGYIDLDNLPKNVYDELMESM